MCGKESYKSNFQTIIPCKKYPWLQALKQGENYGESLTVHIR